MPLPSGIVVTLHTLPKCTQLYACLTAISILCSDVMAHICILTHEDPGPTESVLGTTVKIDHSYSLPPDMDLPQSVRDYIVSLMEQEKEELKRKIENFI